MVKFFKSFKQIFNFETEKQKGVGLYVGVESFSLCIINDIENFKETTRFFSSKFPATIKPYATDFFTDERSAKYIFDFIKKFVPHEAEDINLTLPDNIADIAVTPLYFATDEQAIGYATFQSLEIFNRQFTKPILSVCRNESSRNKHNKEPKSKYIVSHAEMANMILLKECAAASNIDLTAAEPIALCSGRAYSNISQGNVLFVFVSLSHLFLITLLNGRPENFYIPNFDTEEDGFIDEFSKTVLCIIENSHLERDTLKIKIAGDEMKYKICETLDKLNIAKEVSLAKCRLDLTSVEDELSFGAALRNL